MGECEFLLTCYSEFTEYLYLLKIHKVVVLIKKTLIDVCLITVVRTCRCLGALFCTVGILQ